MSDVVRPNLAQQRKRAKDLRQAHQRGDADAAARIIARLPRAAGRLAAEVLATPFTLSEAQLVVAREAGFPTWPRLKHDLVEAGLDAVVEAALAGDPSAAAALAGDPALPRRSLPLAAAVGADEAALALLAQRPERATRPEGPRGWTPLLYACSARFGRGDPAVAARRVPDPTRPDRRCRCRCRSRCTGSLRARRRPRVCRTGPGRRLLRACSPAALRGRSPVVLAGGRCRGSPGASR